MRKIITAILLIALMMNMLWGCTQSPDPNMNDIEPAEERFVYSSRMYGTLIRYDVIDKKATIACPDPLCEHGQDCPVTNIHSSYVSKDYIMYGKLENGLLGGNTIYCYDLKSGAINKVLECPRYQQITFIKDAAYFTAAHMEYNTDGSPKGSVWDVYRYVMSSNELIKLNDESFGDELVVVEYTEDKILWDDYGVLSGHYFWTDYNFENKEDGDFNSRVGNYNYDFEFYYGDDGVVKYDITRTEIKTGESENVVTGVASYRLDNMDDPKGVVYNTYENDDGRTIYYKSLSDLSVKELCRIPDEYALTSDLVYPNIGTTLYAGGYIGIYVSQKDADHSEAHNGNTMLFVNIDTGDTFVLTP